MFTKISYIKRKFRGLVLKIFNCIENNENCNFETNGEKVFIDKLFHKLRTKSKMVKVVFDIGANVGDYSQMVVDKSDIIDMNNFNYANYVAISNKRLK